MDFLIIGGDAAGMSAASRAKRNRPDMNVTVLEKTTDVSYSACGMPYNIADPDRNIEDLVVRRAEIFREQNGINLLTGACAQKIDPALNSVSYRSIEGREFQLAYDKLLIATGASPIMPDLPGFNLPGVMALKNLENGRKIKNYIKENRIKKTVIIGMGSIALEMCEALKALAIDVDMVKTRPVFLPWMEKNLAQVVRKEVESSGVNLYCGRIIEGIENSAAGFRVVCSDIAIDCDMVLVAIGVKPNSEIAENAGIALGLNKAIAVNKTLKSSDNNIYAAGDCDDAFHVVTSQKTWIPLALRANRAGWAAADNICGKKIQLQGVAGTAVFKTFNLEVGQTGLNLKQAKESGFTPAEVMIKTPSRAHAHPGSSTLWVNMVGDKKSGRLLGVQMAGREGAVHRINAAVVALHNRMTVENFSQSDLAYAPPFGPVWDPLLTAANQLLKKM